MTLSLSHLPVVVVVVVVVVGQSNCLAVTLINDLISQFFLHLMVADDVVDATFWCEINYLIN